LRIWEGWIRFFLRGIVQTAQEATATAEQIFELRESHRSLEITGQKRSRVYRYEPYLDLFDEPTEPNGARKDEESREATET
jgi:hypothetical protein